jgi:hypothetical protein
MSKKMTSQNKLYEIKLVPYTPPPSTHFGLFLVEKKNIECSLPAANPQNTSHINLFSLPINEMTPMTMSMMVAICPIWLLWLAKC